MNKLKITTAVFIGLPIVNLLLPASVLADVGGIPDSCQVAIADCMTQQTIDPEGWAQITGVRYLNKYEKNEDGTNRTGINFFKVETAHSDFYTVRVDSTQDPAACNVVNAAKVCKP